MSHVGLLKVMDLIRRRAITSIHRHRPRRHVIVQVHRTFHAFAQRSPRIKRPGKRSRAHESMPTARQRWHHPICMTIPCRRNSNKSGNKSKVFFILLQFVHLNFERKEVQMMNPFNRLSMHKFAR